MTTPRPISAIVDWLSFSIPQSEYKASDDEVFSGYAAMRFQVLRALQALPQSLREGLVLLPVSPRSPFQWAHQCSESNLRISGGGNLDYVHIEMPGKACAYAREVKVLDQMLYVWKNNASRLDIAIDIECDLDPTDVARWSQNKKIKTRSQFISDTGTTAYLGSVKSDKFTRIYRYNEGHERSHLLRFEFVFRDKLAKGAIHALKEQGLPTLAKSLYAGLEIHQTLLDEAVESLSKDDTHISLYPDRRKGETELWIEKQVVPALLRLEREGVILSASEFMLELIERAKNADNSVISSE